MKKEVNVFQFRQSVEATTIRPINVSGLTIPGGHAIRLRGYQSDGSLNAESEFPGRRKVLTFGIPGDSIKGLKTDTRLLKEQLTGVSGMLAEESAGRKHISSLAKLLGN